MADNRIKRDSDTREKTVRKASWNRPELLPTPEAADGFAYHWVRLSTMGTVDAMNISSKLREGWTPVKASEHPEITVVGTENQDFKDNIVIGGLMLCKAPQEMVDERNAYYAEQADAQVQSVDNNFMRENDARMPLFNENKTKVSFGDGN